MHSYRFHRTVNIAWMVLSVVRYAVLPRFFEIYGWIAIGVGVGIIIIAPFLQRLMHLDTLNKGPKVRSVRSRH